MSSAPSSFTERGGVPRDRLAPPPVDFIHAGVGASPLSEIELLFRTHHNHRARSLDVVDYLSALNDFRTCSG